MQIKPIALAAALALAAPLAHAGNISYTATMVTSSNGGTAHTIDDKGQVAMWAIRNDSPSGGVGWVVPKVWAGSMVDATHPPGFTYFYPGPLFIGDTGQLYGVAEVSGVGKRGVRYDPQSGVITDLGYAMLPTGRGEGGAMLVDLLSASAVVQGTQLTTLPVPDGATGSWGYAAAGGVVVGKVAIDGLGYAAAFRDGKATLLHSGPSIAWGTNARGQWAGFVGTGVNTQAVVGGPAGLTVIPGLAAGSGATAIAINDSGQATAGLDVRQGVVRAPVLFGNGHATRLQELVAANVYIDRAMDINAHGQILAANGDLNPMLLTPQGTLAWASTGGGNFNDAAHWDSGLGFAPSRFLEVRYDSVASQGAWVDRDVRMLSFSMGSGTGRTALDLQRGALLRADNGMTIEANGVLGGDGRVMTPSISNRGRIAPSTLTFTASGSGVDGTVYNYGVIVGAPQEGATLRVGRLFNLVSVSSAGVSPGRMRVDAGQSLRVEGILGNFGDIEVFGGSFSHAGPGALYTATTPLYPTELPGRILARDASLRFESGAAFAGGQLAFSGGVNDVFGRIDVLSPSGLGKPEGKVIVSGRAEVTFWDAVHNNGELRVSAGSTATFFGLVSGAGRFTGSGTKFFEGGFAPGNSPALVTIEGDLTMGASSPLMMELGGTAPGSQHDKLDVQGTLSLAGGPLQVVWWGGFQAGAGDRFDLLDWGQLEGSFGAISLPTLGTGLLWDTSALYTLGELRVTAVPEPAAASLLLAGLAAMAWMSRRRREPGLARQG
jgi:hypothetical protein